MRYDIPLGDNGFVDSPYLEIHDPLNSLTAQRRRDVAFVLGFKKPVPSKSIVLAKNERFLGEAHGFDSWSKATTYAVSTMEDLYRKARWRLPLTGVTALVDPFPQDYLIALWDAGVSTIVSRNRLYGNPIVTEQNWIDRWLGPLPMDRSQRFSEGKAFVLGPYNAKAWEASL